MSTNSALLKIELIPEDGNENRLDNDWQTGCKELKYQLSDIISDYEASLEAQPRNQSIPVNGVDGTSRSYTGERGGLPDFASLILSTVTPEMVAAVGGAFWVTLTKWFENRQGCSCVIRVGDSEFHLNNLTKEELIEIMDKQLNN